MFDTNYKLLKTIIEDNKNTEYGKKYNFSELKTIDEYKKKIPLTTYELFIYIRFSKSLSEKNSMHNKSFI